MPTLISIIKLFSGTSVTPQVIEGCIQEHGTELATEVACVVMFV